MLGWCMWQVMHCAVGMARVKTWRIGWPRSPTAAWFASAGRVVAAFAQRGDGGIDGRGLAVAAVARIGQRMAGLAVVGVDDVAAGAARMAIVAGLVVGAHEPHVRVVEPGLVDVEHGDRDADAGAGAAIGLAQVGPPRLLEPLDRAGRIGQADLRELRADIAPAALEHAEDVAGRDDVPGRQGIELGQHAAGALLVGQLAGRTDQGGLAAARIGLADNVILEGQDAVIIGRAAPEHGAGRHERALGCLDDFDMAGAAALADNAIVAGVGEADEFRRLDVQQRVAARRIGARREMPAARIARQHMRPVLRQQIVRARPAATRRAL